MAQITRSTKVSGGSTLSSNTLARAADVETDVLTLFNAHNNHDTGSSKWQVVSALNSAGVPLLVDNSTGSQDVAQFKTNGTTQWNITSAGVLTSNSKTIAGLPAASANGQAVRYEQVNTLWAYRKPNIQFATTTTVNIETGIMGTSGQASILFPDGTLRQDSTAARITLNIGQVAALSGTAQSGLRTGAAVANTWYAVYAVKTTDNASNFVAVADTVLPIQANYATLNTNFGTNGWVYLGSIRYGDNSGATTSILDFVQSGNMFMFKNSHSGVNTTPGTRLAGTTATSISYAYSAGTGTTNIPSNISHIFVTVVATAETGSMNVYDSGSTRFKARWAMGNLNTVIQIWTPAAEGVASDTSAGASTAKNIVLSGFVDSALGVGPTLL